MADWKNVGTCGECKHYKKGDVFVQGLKIGDGVCKHKKMDEQAVFSYDIVDCPYFRKEGGGK